MCQHHVLVWPFHAIAHCDFDNVDIISVVVPHLSQRGNGQYLEYQKKDTYLGELHTCFTVGKKIHMVKVHIH